VILDNIPQISSNQVQSIEWQSHDLMYDLQLYELGSELDEFIVINPDRHIEKSWHNDLKHYIDDVPDTRKCIVFTFEGNWVAKIFKEGWYPYHGYESIEIPKPKVVWRKNPDLDKLMTFENDPFAVFEPNRWDIDYTLVWYIDPRVNPLPDKVWAMTCEPLGAKVKGIKDMGYVMPEIDVEYSEYIPDLGLNIDEMYPAYYELENTHAWDLDTLHTSKRMWVVKFSPRYRDSKSWKWKGTITPQVSIEYNKDLGELDYDLSYTIPLYDFTFEHVWMLDRKHLHEGEEDIWAFKVRISNDIEGVKIVDYIAPSSIVEVNTDLEGMSFKIDHVPYWHDLNYSHVWYLNIENEKVWAARLTHSVNSKKITDMGTIEPILPDHLSVVFISYGEPNAEKNWERVLEKAPWAQRVDGVKGIFNAHKAAARLSETDMFYVVDGDAWLMDNWTFDFQPTVYDRKCTFIWHSQNPVNGLVYGYGGVKLFSKSKVVRAKKWTTLDFATTVMDKLKVIDTVSNISKFNTDAFSTWRSAFRECVKLQDNLLNNPNSTEDKSRLDVWVNEGADADFGQYSVDAARAAIEFVNSVDTKELLNINDRVWLKNKFRSIYGEVIK